MTDPIHAEVENCLRMSLQIHPPVLGFCILTLAVLGLVVLCMWLGYIVGRRMENRGGAK